MVHNLGVVLQVPNESEISDPGWHLGAKVASRLQKEVTWGRLGMCFLRVIRMCLNIVLVCLVASGRGEFLPHGPWPDDAITWKLGLPSLRNPFEV